MTSTVASMNDTIIYEDAFGNLQTNVGPNIGEIVSSVLASTEEATIGGTEIVGEEL